MLRCSIRLLVHIANVQYAKRGYEVSVSLFSQIWMEGLLRKLLWKHADKLLSFTEKLNDSLPTIGIPVFM